MYYRAQVIETYMNQATSLNCFWRDNVFGLGVLMENKGEILYRNTVKRNCNIWCARIRGMSHVTPLLGNASNAAVDVITSSISGARAYGESRDPVTKQRE
jgi:hypothetical protein